MELDLSGILLIFLFGLRHGMAADHITVIDGLGMHLHHQGRNWIVPWLGTIFAVGHGIIITVYIAFAHLGIQKLHADNYKWLDWIPVILLFTIAFLNLRTLKRNAQPKPVVPAHTSESGLKKRSFTALLISVCMIMIFDTLADAAAWGYSAAASRSFFSALVVGLFFTLGMILTDTIDSRLLAKTIIQTQTNSMVLKQRRTLSWVIIVFSFAIGLQKLMAIFNASLTPSEGTDLMIGGALILAVAVSYFRIYRAIKAD